MNGRTENQGGNQQAASSCPQSTRPYRGTTHSITRKVLEFRQNRATSTMASSTEAVLSLRIVRRRRKERGQRRKADAAVLSSEDLVESFCRRIQVLCDSHKVGFRPGQRFTDPSLRLLRANLLCSRIPEKLIVRWPFLGKIVASISVDKLGAMFNLTRQQQLFLCVLLLLLLTGWAVKAWRTAHPPTRSATSTAQ